MGNKIVAIIPCYNEEKYIAEIVHEVKRYVNDVVVIDNNSTDSSAAEASSEKAIVYHCKKQGMGAALQYGIQKTIETIPDTDIFVILDGDGQHKPSNIPALLKPILNNEASYILGIRHNNGNMPKYRKVGNYILEQLCNLWASNKYNDTQSGFRIFSRRVAITTLANSKEKGFGVMAESLLRARKLNIAVKEVPITCLYHKNFEENSSMNPISHGLSVAMSIAKWRIKLWC